MSQQIVQVIQSLEATRSRNEKERILTENKDLPGLKEFFKAALDPFNTYYIKKIPEFSQDSVVTLNICEAIPMLDSLKNRSVTGNSAIVHLSNMLNRMTVDESSLLTRIIKKDPDCGVSRDTVNKIWKDLIKQYPVLLCSAYSKKAVDKLNWKAGVFVQLKSDGARCNIVIDENGGVEMFSRQGRPIDCKGRFDYLGEKHRSVMIDGELLYRNADGSEASRKQGNGIVNKAIKGTISEEETANLFLMAWDVIPLDDFKAESSNIKYIGRFHTLQAYIDDDGIYLTPTEIVHSIEEAMVIYQKYRELGLEGAILKDIDALWCNDRSKKQVKLKAEIVSTLKVVGYQEGRDQFTGLMGALICESECGKVNVSIGGGWSLDMRAQVAADHHNTTIKYSRVILGADTDVEAIPAGDEVIGRYLDVLHNGLVDCGGEWSLYLPRANTGDFRYDCSKADTYEEIASKK